MINVTSILPLCSEPKTSHCSLTRQLSPSIKSPFYMPHADKSPNCCWSGKKRRRTTGAAPQVCALAGRVPRNAYIKQTHRGDDKGDFRLLRGRWNKKNRSKPRERFLLSGQSHDRCTMALIEPIRSEINSLSPNRIVAPAATREHFN